ncbi:type III secretion protein [Pseudomonas karstica]|nr:type III secretion protein [Pseudomonas karstica]
MLQALGNFYMGFGKLLGGGSNQQHCQQNKPGDSARLRELETKMQSLTSASVNYGHPQPQNNIMINNSNTNTLVSR